MAKLRVGILFGGRSTEHEVSVASATTVYQALDPARYAPVLIGIDTLGCWHLASASSGLLPEDLFESPAAQRVEPTLTRDLGLSLDVVFPVLHGRFGEDGALQGMLDLAGVAYVGSGVLASAAAMDKVATKRLCRDAGIPVVPCLHESRRELARDAAPFVERVEREYGYPVFVKPVNTGSSVGISRARDREELRRALADAGRYDLAVLVEPALDAREIECALLGGDVPEASLPGEIRTRREFYDYEAKYVSEETELVLPAPIDEATTEQLRDLAVRAFRALGCYGLARADFFLERQTGALRLNELNTLPGMTPDGSLYWRAWEASGVALPELIDRLIELALERQRERAGLEVRYRSR
ncbi:MAG: D-alanine--D-alanine ligase family protein [Myxococcota bacterium]